MLQLSRPTQGSISYGESGIRSKRASASARVPPVCDRETETNPHSASRLLKFLNDAGIDAKTHYSIAIPSRPGIRGAKAHGSSAR